MPGEGRHGLEAGAGGSSDERRGNREMKRAIVSSVTEGRREKGSLHQRVLFHKFRMSASHLQSTIEPEGQYS
jgi:hypothetical protein